MSPVLRIAPVANTRPCELRRRRQPL